MTRYWGFYLIDLFCSNWKISNEISLQDKYNFIDYTAYHDFDKFSAVIYVENLKCLIGVIDTRYSIECLPISQLNRKHHIVKSRVDGYIIQINSDHCDSSCYNNPNTIPIVPNPSSSESNTIPPTNSDSLYVEYGGTIRQNAPNLELKLANTNLKELPSTSFNPDSSLPNGPDSFINPSFPNSESSIIYNNKASTLHLPNADVATERENSYLSLVPPQFEKSVFSLPGETTSSSVPPPGFINFDTVLSDNPKSSNDFPSLSYIANLLYNPDSLNTDPDNIFLQSQQNLDFTKHTDTDLERHLPEYPDSASSSTSDNHKCSNDPSSLSPNTDSFSNFDSLNIDPDDTFFQSQQNLDLPELTDTDLEQLLPKVPESVPSSARGSHSSFNPQSPDFNLGHPDGSKSPIINQNEILSLFNPQSPISLDFSALMDTVNERNLPSTSDIDSPPIKRPRIDKRSDEKRLNALYPEIMIFVSYDITEYEKKVNGPRLYSHWLIYRLIAYFNAVDMLFAQLIKYGIDIHINIAGIVIERHRDALKTCFDTENRVHVMDKPFLNYIQQFIKKSERAIKMDSFDFFHLATLAKLNGGNHNYGFSTERFSIFDQRANKVSKDDMKFAGSIVKHLKYVQNYVAAAREIAHLMKVDYETTENSFGNDAQCPGLMQEHNIRCLKWSDKSIESFKIYLSESLDRCFLLNHPKSLLPKNKPVELISPAKICSCYVQEEQHSEMIKSIAVISEDCNAPMVCLKPDVLGVLKPITHLPFPFDGTGCGNNKVCFKRKCVKTLIEYGHKDS
ncbi:hypothetical protein PV325_005070 [Microctonus aethiopoides]|nr:hypothetical protein PV325_005070 [Microctonus aethiopoides]